MVIYRRMEPGDLSAVRKLMRQLSDIHSNGRPDIYRECDPLDDILFSAMLAGENTFSIVAELDGNAVGLAFGVLNRLKDDPRRCDRTVLHIEDICVLEDCRGHGIGRGLLDECAKWARDNGADAVELMAWSFNRSAIDFYKRYGMTERSVMLEMKL